MKVFGDYHMHTRASDGKGTVADKAARARELGLREIAIADHGCGSLFFHQTAEKPLRSGGTSLAKTRRAGCASMRA